MSLKTTRSSEKSLGVAPVVTSGETPATVTWSTSSEVCCHVIVTQQRIIAEKFAPEFHNLPLQAKERTWVNCKLITACY